MSVTVTSKIVTSLDTASRAVTVQLANLDWVTTIEGINVSFHTKAHEVSGIGICKGLRKVCRCLVTGLYSIKKKTYLWCCDIYIRLAYRSRSILKLLECRGGSEGSTEDHYSIRALARYMLQSYSTPQVEVPTSRGTGQLNGMNQLSMLLILFG